MRITAENTIALVIDIQEKLVPSIYAHKYLVKTTQNLLEALNILNIPKIIAAQYPNGLGSTIPEIAKYFRPEDKVFPKTSFSAVEDENLFQELQNSKNVSGQDTKQNTKKTKDFKFENSKKHKDSKNNKDFRVSKDSKKRVKAQNPKGKREEEQ